jgi:hypothetical protein
VTSTVAETRKAADFGGISRNKNTRRIFVGPDAIRTLAVTGTWALEANTNVLSLATDDVGGAGELLVVPFPAEFSDMIVRGSAAVDRGVRIIALEVLYQVAASALADIDLAIYKTTWDSEGVGTATAMTKTDARDVAADAGTEVDEHRFTATIAESNREFLDGGKTFHAVLDIDDGTSSDVNIFGAIWHLERVEE